MVGYHMSQVVTLLISVFSVFFNQFKDSFAIINASDLVYHLKAALAVFFFVKQVLMRAPYA